MVLRDLIDDEGTRFLAAQVVTAAGGQPGQDPLDALASYSRQHRGLLDELLRHPPVDASFSNWHS